MKYLILIGLFAIAYGEIKNVQQKFSKKANTDINAQITKELQASYYYQALSQYFARADVALPGFSKFFSAASKEERSHAEKLMDYINKRGGDVQLEQIKLKDVCDIISKGLTDRTFKFTKTKSCLCYFMTKEDDSGSLTDLECDNTNRGDWYNGLLAMEDTLVLERYVNDQLLTLHSTNGADPHLSHVLEHEFLDEQVEAIKDISDKIQQLKRVGKGLGEYTFDQKLQ